MELPLDKRLERLRMGDVLVSPTGHQIEFVQPGSEYNTVYAVRHKRRVLFLSIDDNGASHSPRKGIEQTMCFLDTFDWGEHGMPAPASWHYVHDGSDGLLWDNDITALSVCDNRWFFEPSPYTGRFRRQITIPHRKAFVNVYHDDEGLQTIVRRQKRGTQVTDEPQFVRGRIYAFKPSAKSKTVYGLAQLRLIEKRLLQTLTSADVLSEGYTSWHAFQDYWRRSQNGKFDLCQWVYTMHFDVVATTAESKPVGQEIMETSLTDWLPMQLALAI